MLNGTLRYCSYIRCFHPVTSVTSNGIVEATTAFGCFRTYSNDKGSCCKDIVQTQGKRVEPWPKPDPPPPAWRLECPRDPQPPNYDPYRIKVPDVVCPPLPPSTAKWMAVLTTTPHSQSGPTGGGPHQAPEQPQSYGPYGHPNYGQQNPQASEEQSEESPPSAGFFGFLKGLFRGKAKTGKGEGEVSMEVPIEASSEQLKISAANFGSAINPVLDLFRNSPVVHPDYWTESEKNLPDPPSEVQEPLPRLGYHGKNIYKYAFHEPWKPLDRLTLLSHAEKQENGLTEVTDTEKY